MSETGVWAEIFVSRLALTFGLYLQETPCVSEPAREKAKPGTKPLQSSKYLTETLFTFA
ncbi:hypothetical protein EMIT0P253_100051 [Pseudomonas sp. IT-P253]